MFSPHWGLIDRSLVPNVAKLSKLYLVACFPSKIYDVWCMGLGKNNIMITTSYLEQSRNTFLYSSIHLSCNLLWQIFNIAKDNGGYIESEIARHLPTALIERGAPLKASFFSSVEILKFKADMPFPLRALRQQNRVMSHLPLIQSSAVGGGFVQ